MSGGRCPVIDPSFPNPVGSLDQFAAGFGAVLHYHNYPSVEIHRNHVLYGHLRPVGLEYAHKVKVQIGPTGSRHIVVVIELSECAIVVILPDYGGAGVRQACWPFGMGLLAAFFA